MTCRERFYILMLLLIALIVAIVGINVVSQYIVRNVPRYEREHEDMHERNPNIPHR